MAAVIEETAPPEADVPVATDVTFRIRRFLPEHDSEPHWEDYTVALFPTDRVLTALEKIKGELDGTLSPITVEAIKGLSVEKDLIVDMEPFFAAYRQVLPFLIPEGHEPSRERLQSAEDRARFDDTTKCILCAACTTSCPVYWTDDQYFGPAAIVAAHRFIFDSRDS
ncbi:MAG: succinate dehydrogenase iron-sulfur subunit, partial [Actinobacteria bacterium]|nr:succinate dehydrogenase iron-sulfur subunit [Actinomycetota bacterium]